LKSLQATYPDAQIVDVDGWPVIEVPNDGQTMWFDRDRDLLVYDKQSCVPGENLTLTRGTKLIPIQLRRRGRPSEFYYAAQCARCGKLILDFETANVSTMNWDFSDPTYVGKVGNARAYRLDADAFVLCRESCDSDGGVPWVPAKNVFRNDQRRDFEKEGWL
jgi:hypothetical protein